MIDDVTKECLAAIADTSISGRRAARELDAVIAWRGKPDLIVSDHGTEFTSNAMLAWAQTSRVDWHFVAPGKPMQNGICEAFNGRMCENAPNSDPTASVIQPIDFVRKDENFCEVNPCARRDPSRNAD